jgi:uncharacterized protein
MRSRSRSPFLLLLAVLVALAGCRRGEERAEAAAPPAAPADPWAVPPDSLYGATAAENLRVRPVELELRGVPRGWDGMRIAVLSDLMLGLWPDNARVAEAAARRAVAAEPDLIVLLGNLAADQGGAAELARALAPLRGIPTLAVLGPRDVEDEERAAAITAALEGLGATVLRNQAVAFARGADTAYVVGIEPAYAAFAPAQQAQLFAGLPEGAATPLLLSHQPGVLPRLPERRFAAVLAGNSLCSEVEVPGAPRLASHLEGDLGATRLPRSTRLFRASENTMFLACALGYSFVPARFATAPEVALVTLIRIPEPRAEGEFEEPAVPATPPAAEAPAAEPEPQ